MKKIEPFRGKAGDLSEIYQAVGMQFSFALPTSDPDKFKQVHQFVLCRDFLHDAVRAHLTGKPYRIYGFVFDPSKDTVYTRRMLMLVKLPGIDKKMQRIENLLHLFEKRMKVKRTIVHKTNLKNTLLLEGSRVWMASSQMVSLYTLLPRIACNDNKIVVDSLETHKTFRALMSFWKDIKYESDSDIKYLPALGKYVGTIISNRSALGLTPEKTLTVPVAVNSYFHNYGGIVSLCQANNVPPKHVNDIRKTLRKLHRRKSGVKNAVK